MYVKPESAEEVALDTCKGTTSSEYDKVMMIMKNQGHQVGVLVLVTV